MKISIAKGQLQLFNVLLTVITLETFNNNMIRYYYMKKRHSLWCLGLSSALPDWLTMNQSEVPLLQPPC